MNPRPLVRTWPAAPLLALILCACAPTVEPADAPLSVAAALSGSDATGHARATEVPSLEFPRDHGAHPSFRTEWWYWTGNLRTATGRRFGVQLVFFQQALAPAMPPRSSGFAARQLVLAHAALTDAAGSRFHHAERMNRAAGGLAGVTGPAAGQPFQLWCDDWSASAIEPSDGFLPLRLRAQDREFAFDLRVDPGKPLVLQGDRGLSQKSRTPGNASIYYSMTRLPIAGTVTVGEERHDVRGEGWLDREWSTSALDQDQVGWDWFSLQLDDGSELMWYQLRRRDGSIDDCSSGLLVAAAGSTVRLATQDLVATPLGSWRSPDGRSRYPLPWRLRVASHDLDLVVTPILPDQELHTLVRYWEGAVDAHGTRSGAPVQGHGYLEMTGYADRR